MKKALTSRDDIELFVHEFYRKLLADPKISHFFDHLLQENDLEKHLETIIDFWEDLLFLTTKYGKNAMKPHIKLHQKIPFEQLHFQIWLDHFNGTIDYHFIGKKALLAKQRALSIATIMQIKLKN
ncbi:MAG: group III truncated hemoglobin [Flavobacteriaceae bacterium]|nr:group III truncated hemoglobin [Flavobacteriaceae bacterium]